MGYGSSLPSSSTAPNKKNNQRRPVIAAAIQRSVAAAYGTNGASGVRQHNLRRYLQRILVVLAITAVYTAFLYKSGTKRKTPRGVWLVGLVGERGDPFVVCFCS